MRIKKDYFIGDLNFYKRVLWVAAPIIIQNTITNIVNLLDNVMVGRIGTLEMSAVAIINQLIFIVNLAVFGGIAGSGIFSTQYAGAKDNEGIRHCFRIKLITVAIILFFTGIILGFFPEKILGLFISEAATSFEKETTLYYGLQYLRIMLIGLVPFCVSQAYSSTLRETGETKIPMYASIVSILINLVFNYLLIFGAFGFPKWGVAGAAVATVLSRFAEMAILIIYTHKNQNKLEFAKSLYGDFYIPRELCIKVIKKGSPLLFNELLFSMGIAFYLQCYSARGLMVVAAANIASTANNIFNVLLVSLGSATSIMVGQCLGANEVEKAKKTAWRLIFLSVVPCILIGGIVILISGAIPQMYKTEKEVKDMASSFLISLALMLPFDAFVHSIYFTLRSGGKTIITTWFDSGFMWFIGVPVAYILANFTSLSIELVYFSVRALDILKTIIGTVLIQKGIWINNIVDDKGM